LTADLPTPATMPVVTKNAISCNFDKIVDDPIEKSKVYGRFECLAMNRCHLSN
jgi:hypothetical protein